MGPGEGFDLDCELERTHILVANKGICRIYQRR